MRSFQQEVDSHAKYQYIPVVVLTASVMNNEVDMLRNAGFNGVIAKPFTLKALPYLLKRIENVGTIWNITEL